MMKTKYGRTGYVTLAGFAALLLVVVQGPGCSHTESDEGMSKSKAAELMSGEEADRDYCAENGWYDDGECDSFCEDEDPDCSDDSDGKADDGGDKSSDAYEPCGDKICGQRCTKCPPDDEDCVETAAVKYCQPDGSCTSGEPSCDDKGSEYNPCANKTCGEQCTKCPPNDEDCVETDVVKYCQPDGTCTGGAPSCESDGGDDYAPCADKTCGERCTKCPPDDEDCVETQVVNYCTADGECAGGTPSCN